MTFEQLAKYEAQKKENERILKKLRGSLKEGMHTYTLEGYTYTIWGWHSFYNWKEYLICGKEKTESKNENLEKL